MIILPILFIVTPMFLFPVKIIQDNSLIDFFMHFIGLIYGVIISFAFFKFKFNKNME